MPRLRKLEACGNLIESIQTAFESPNLEIIDFSENKISKIAPDCFRALSSLRMLDLHQNRLTFIGEFPLNSKLETLLLASNRLAKIRDVSAETMPELKILDLKDNKITEFEDCFFTLTKIHTLDLTNNEFNRLPAELGLMFALKKLMVVGNPLKTIRSEIKNGSTEKLKQYLAALIDVNKVNAQQGLAKANLVKKELTIVEEKNDLERIIRGNISNNSANLLNLKLSNVGKEILLFENLSSINLSKNALAEFPVILSGLRNLRTLILNDNQIGVMRTNELSGFDTLETLEMQNNKLVSFCDDFENYEKTPVLSGLKFLDLSKNKLAQLSIIFASFPKLDNLCLSFNAIVNIEPLIYQENNTLDTLVLTNNKIETVSENIGNLFKLSVLLLENNNVKNFPPEISCLNLKSFAIVGNPSLLSTEKMSSKGTIYILNHLKNKLTEDKIDKHVQKQKAFKPRATPVIQNTIKQNTVVPNNNTNDQKELASNYQEAQKTIPYNLSDQNKLNTQNNQTEGLKKGQPTDAPINKQNPQTTDIFGQPIHSHKKEQKSDFEIEKSDAQPKDILGYDIKNKQVDNSIKQSVKTGNQDQAGQILQKQDLSVKVDTKVLTPEQVEITKQIADKQSTLDNDFNLNNVKRLTLKKEVNALRAKLNQ